MSLHVNSAGCKGPLTVRQRLTPEMRQAAVSAQITCIYQMQSRREEDLYKGERPIYRGEAKIDYQIVLGSTPASCYYASPKAVLNALLKGTVNSLQELFSFISSIEVKPIEGNCKRVEVTYKNGTSIKYEFLL